MVLSTTGQVWAIPPNYPITNTAEVQYVVGGSDYVTSGNVSILTDGAAGNSAPYAVNVAPPQVNEAQPLAVVGTLAVSDSDPADTHSFSISDPRFEVVGNQLQLAPGVILDFEQEASITLSITTTDNAGASVTQVLTIVVVDVNEAPTAIALDDNTVAANEAGALVGNLTVTDVDAGDSHNLTVDDARFVIDGGALRLAPAESLPLGTTVTVIVTATDSGGLVYSQSFDVMSQPPGSGAGNNASLTLLQYAPSVAGAAAVNVAPSQCDAGAGYTNVTGAQTAYGQAIPLPGTVALLDVDYVKTGETLLVQVVDVDANLDSTVIEQIFVDLSTPAGDSERLLVRETGDDTGIFAGYINTVAGAVVSADCQLQTGPGGSVDAMYTDVGNAADVATDRVLVDPFWVVFDSASGQPINGAIISIVDLLGNPVTVFDDDGVSPFAATVASGDSTAGFSDGLFRFPFVNPGDYQLQVIPPNRFAHPSVVPDGALQTLPGAPYSLGPGSRGQAFTVPIGPAVRVDIPLDVTPLVPTPSQVELLSVNAAAGTPGSVGVTQCFDGQAFQPAGPANSLTAGAIATPGTFALLPTSRIVRGDVLIIRLLDPDQDIDPYAADSVSVDVQVSGGDVERLQLIETNQSTGVFTGYLQTSDADVVSNYNCVLEASANSGFSVSYADPDDAGDQSAASATLDPSLLVFASDSGALIDGARVTLIDAVTGLPASNAVFAADGVTGFPAEVVSGGQVSLAGQVYDFATGSVFFPVITPGDYRLQVVPPVSYSFPSQVSDPQLAGLPGGPFNVVTGSRGEVFSVGAAGLSLDVPLDPVAADVFVTKQASKDAVAIGDFLQYLVTVENASAIDEISAAGIVDTLPAGFRVVADSVRLDEQATTMQVSDDARQLALQLGQLPPGARHTLSYVVQVSAGTDPGVARNVVQLTGVGVAGRAAAHADVTVRDDLFTQKTFIVGRVSDGECDLPSDQRAGLAGVRVWLEDGTFAVTDEQGKYHFEGVEPGTHVVQLDTASLPLSHEALACENTSAFAGSAISQFVDLQAGTVWRADFTAHKIPGKQSDVVTRLDASSEPGSDIITYTYHIAGGAVPLTKMRATVMLADGLAYVPDSSFLNGIQRSEPLGIGLGALTFRLPDTAEDFAYELTFKVTAPSAAAELASQAVTLFSVDGHSHRTEVLANQLSWLDDAAASDHSSTSADATYTVQQQTEFTHNVPYVLPEQDRGAVPEFDKAWLAANRHKLGIVWPPARYNPVMPAVAVAVVHPSDLRPHLLVDGKLVNALNLEATLTDTEHDVTVTTWDGVPISESDSLLAVQLLDAQGQVVHADNLPIHYSGAPARVEFVAEHSYLVADGLFPPVLAVRLFDRAGYPLRAGATGEFSVSPPFVALNKTRHLENLSNQFTNQRYRVLRDGIAYIQLEPTVQTGDVELSFRFDQVRHDSIRARMVPGQRDWIMVGLVEGSYARRELSGNLQALAAAGLADETVTDGRVAFYAKGMVRGDWLLTAAYDTDKQFERQLRQQIDPNQFYTLYGDGSTQRYDAESQRKLYLKLEKARFSGLFGDFDTEFQRSELARYERRMNGVNLGYHGDRVEAKVFVSDTDQVFVRDELAGDGTSGIYRLSRQRLVRNSEQLNIVVRDRFDLTRVISTETLTRYNHYSIDYDLGTLIMREPVLSQDDSFNPIFIEVEYEVAADNAEELVAGARLAYRLDDQDSEIAVTYIHDDSATQGGELAAADLTWQYNQAQKVTLEVAASDSVTGGRGEAYLLQLEHTGEDLAGRAYVRQQDAGFGLGHQSTFEKGVRKLGVEGEYRATDSLTVRGQAFEQSLLDSDAQRLVVDTQVEYRQGANRWSAGVRGLEERTAGGRIESAQVLAGASRELANKKLILHSNAEIDVSSRGEAGDYPSRAVLGAEYKILPDVSLLAEQEFSWSDSRDTQDTRVGLRAKPWRGADVKTLLQRQGGEQGERLYATTGVMQQWRMTENWLLDAGFDRVQTLRQRGVALDPASDRFNPVNPPASGSDGNDFSAYYLGAGYQAQVWNATTRLEFHSGDVADKWNLLAGVNRQLAEGRVISSSLAVLNEDLAVGSINNVADLTVGLAWRAQDSRFTVLNRSDLVFEEQQGQNFRSRSRKWVNNLAVNFKPNSRHQISLQTGFKYLLDQIDGEEYSSRTLLLGSEYRYYFHPRWDLGLHASGLKSLATNVVDYSAGASIGFNAFNNSWVSLGYNLFGFEDEDFIAADYTAEGIYLKLRLKFDQHTARRFLEYANPNRYSLSQPANGR